MSGPTNPNLHEMIEKDVAGCDVFFNLDDFGEWHDIDGRRMVCVIDDSGAAPFAATSMGGRTIGRTPLDASRSMGVLSTVRTVIYVRLSDYGPRPAIGRTILLDKRRMKVEALSEDAGVLALTCEEVRV